MASRRKKDNLLTIVIFSLAVFGLVAISSVSVFESNNLTFEIEGKRILREEFIAGESEFETERQINNLNLSGVKANLSTEDLKKVSELARNNFYLWRHFWHLVFGLIVFFVTAFVPYRWWRGAAPYLFGAAIIMLIMVLTSLGADYGTARSWLDIGFLPSIQPAEFAKLALILYLSSWLDQRESEASSFQQGFLPFVFIMSVTALLLALQPDFGSLAVVVCISAAIYFAAGANIFHLLFGALVSVLLALPVFLNSTYIKNRFLAFLDPENDQLGIGYQVTNALVAIGSGGLFGAGFGNSVQKFGYLPEVQSDSIFSAIAEEAGFIKLLILLGAFFIIAWKGYQTAEQTTDRFGKLVAVGITSWIVFQTIINIAVNLALIPTTGITLPFISHGGTSLVTLLAASGILINISNNTHTISTNENFGYRRRVRRPRVTRTRRRRTMYR